MFGTAARQSDENVLLSDMTQAAERPHPELHHGKLAVQTLVSSLATFSIDQCMWKQQPLQSHANSSGCKQPCSASE